MAQRTPSGGPSGAIFKSICRPEFSTKTDDEVHHPSSMDQENTYKPVLRRFGAVWKKSKKPLWSKNHFDRKPTVSIYLGNRMKIDKHVSDNSRNNYGRCKYSRDSNSRSNNVDAVKTYVWKKSTNNHTLGWPRHSWKPCVAAAASDCP
jgi:hypothetical protein